MRSKAAFTLVEIMIVVAIIALLAAIAVPSFLRARQRAQSTKFINNLRIARDSFGMEQHRYPADENRGIIPAGMETYFGKNLNWPQPTPIGGNWDWEYKSFSLTAGISVVGSGASEEQLRGIDQQIDDGNLETGSFRDLGLGRYTLILQR